MDELRILVARLGWPCPATRWWAMQELAARLGEVASKDNTEAALLQFLRSRKLEAEVVEVLCIFWMAARGHGYTPFAELAAIVPAPSPLSDLFLVDLGLPTLARATRLEEAPGEFEIPDDFNGVQGVDLPGIFRTTLGWLDDRLGLPFVRQMAYEWAANRMAYPDAPYQGDPWHFTRPLGSGFRGQYSARAALRVISAYLRTLEIAKQAWRLSPRLVDGHVLLALPIHPTLALLRPRRPRWFPERTDFDGDATAVEGAIRDMVCRVKAERPEAELIAFSSPVVMTMNRCVEVSLVRWSQAAGSQVDEETLAAYLAGYWEHGRVCTRTEDGPLSTTTTLVPSPIEKLVESNSKAWPMAGKLDFDRTGYLQLDLHLSRVFLPMLPGVDKAEVTPHNGMIEVKVGDQVVADLRYWNAGWGPAHPVQLGGNFGTALVSRGTAYRATAQLEASTSKEFYLWQVRTLHRGSSFDEFSETLATGTLFV
jgi:hypothetical protein